MKRARQRPLARVALALAAVVAVADGAPLPPERAHAPQHAVRTALHERRAR